MVISGHVILVGSWCNYWLLVIACTVTIKAFLALIHTIQYETAVVNKVRYKKWRVFGYYFFSKNYCVPTIVGTIELAIYPILISLGSWEKAYASVPGSPDVDSGTGFERSRLLRAPSGLS
jgi:hypothetical protein